MEIYLESLSLMILTPLLNWKELDYGLQDIRIADNCHCHGLKVSLPLLKRQGLLIAEFIKRETFAEPLSVGEFSERIIFPKENEKLTWETIAAKGYVPSD